MKRPLIIGYGNPLREDDGIGWRAAELVKCQIGPGAAKVVECHQLTPELALEIEQASMVIFLDAAIDRAPACIALMQISPETRRGCSHQITPCELLALANQTPPAYWLTCGIASTAWREGLTPEGEAGAKRLAARALSLLREQNRHADAAATHTSHPVPLP